ncbi:MAG: hypothetical protein LEGION0398_MBIBDBAK_00462 [Legionellaceae bacterium]
MVSKEELDSNIENLTSTIEQLKNAAIKARNDFVKLNSETAKNKLTYFETILTSDKISLIGRILKAIIKLFPKIASSIEQEGKRKNENNANLKTAKEISINNGKAISRYQLTLDNLNEQAKKINQKLIISNKISDLKNVLSTTVISELESLTIKNKDFENKISQDNTIPMYSHYNIFKHNESENNKIIVNEINHEGERLTILTA